MKGEAPICAAASSGVASGTAVDGVYPCCVVNHLYVPS